MLAAAFNKNKGDYEGKELENALRGYRMMGYKLTLNSAKIMKTTNKYGHKAITVEAQVKNDGVAPWYYDLDLVLKCGVDKLEFKNGSL